MVLLNTALCLPDLEVDVLLQGQSIVATPQRFIVPGKRFALLPTQTLPNALKQEQIYHPNLIQNFKQEISHNTAMLTIKAWGRCEFCQHLTNQEKVKALSQLTIWKIDALANHLRNQENLFLAFIRVYRLSEPAWLKMLASYQSPERVNKFISLAEYLDVNETQPVLEEDEFTEFKQKLIELKVESSQISIEEKLEPEIIEKASPRDIINDPEWFLKIAEIGNSSDGNSFEKLVRKSFLELGFTNSIKNAKASLEPTATGGAGGLDFYADIPYPIVGECKATKTERVSDGTPAQLIKLGNNILQEHYNGCIKIVLAAGELTTAAHQTSERNHINVIRPETLQKLVELKIAYPGSLDLLELKSILQLNPFGEEADQQINNFISRIWRHLTIRSLLVEAVRQLSIQEGNKSVEARDVRTYYNAIFAKDLIPTLRTEPNTRDLLIELSSPLTAYIGRENSEDKTERFYFLRELKIED